MGSPLYLIPYHNGCKAEYKITYKDNASYFGVFYTTQRCRGIASDNQAVFNIGINANDTTYTQVSGLTQNSVYTITNQANPNTSTNSVKVDDRQSVVTVPANYLNWDSSPQNMYLFAVHRKDTSSRNWGTRIIHYFKYWDANNNLLLDLVPVERKSDGELGMLNNVNGEFLTNIADGTFYKELPA